ncbi:MAG: 2-oxoglutarate dehydrogenase E1 component [Gemmatimonadota bacterium]|nr:2-oxoglutarate dehydrogenase E1 component [Gemmatimonadota bacterium]
MSFATHSENAEYIEALYEQYQRDPSAIPEEWQHFFRGFEFGFARSETASEPEPDQTALQSIEEATEGLLVLEGVQALVQAYRQMGHFVARLDPLGYDRRSLPLLDLIEFGLAEEDLDKTVGNGSFLGRTDGTLKGLLIKLKTTYCRSIGVEYMDIPDKDQRDWLQERVEPCLNNPNLSEDETRRVLARLIAAEEFEQFLHTRYVGQKRFSLEGAESMVPLLDELVSTGSKLGVEEMVIGMAHRGRLNVLAHLLHKPYEEILAEFEGADRTDRDDDEGDVKYHKGYSHDHVTEEGRKVHLSLSFNPSHLELVDPVIEGIVYAKQAYLHDDEGERVVPVLIHGEAAFTGQGIVSETLNLSELPGYRTGGSVHIIINNQLGYTALADETRFTPYPTDIAKEIQAPVFHVNADDPEAVMQAARVAMEFRHRFKVDVFIDLWCYRRHGHNEADDPTLTQPLMYKKIAEHPTILHLYSFQLIAQNRISQEEADDIRARIRTRLEEAQQIARRLQVQPQISSFGGVWQGLTWAPDDWSAQTAVDAKILQRIVERATQVPEGFSLHRTIQRMVEARRAMAAGQAPIDWGCSEVMAFGSLLREGVAVRLTGQDTQRGTFAHRHAVWHDTATGAEHTPLQCLERDQADFVVINTMLSELAVLGFEYGISSADPRRLVLWEAQFGDFVNGAQMVIDQFLSSGEAKWQRMSGLVLLLPHGYEGMGPEHSSARLERFLQSCAKNNMQVAYPTTPAQLFHILRRQMHRNFRKPLVLMTPKSLLRHKQCVSELEEFSTGTFQRVIDDANVADPAAVSRVVLCTGKIYYDLVAARSEQNDSDKVALLRVEELYPFPTAELQAAFDRYPAAKQFHWVQEESQNMGAWPFVQPLLDELLPAHCELNYVGRDEAASPATGSGHLHETEQREIVEQALGRSREVVLHQRRQSG